MTPEEAAAILGVKVDATEDDIRSAYKKRARLTHPDRFSDGSARDRNDASEEFVRVGLARDVLFERAMYNDSDRRDEKADQGFKSEKSRSDTGAPADPVSFEEFIAEFEKAAWGPTPRPSSPRDDTRPKTEAGDRQPAAGSSESGPEATRSAEATAAYNRRTNLISVVVTFGLVILLAAISLAIAGNGLGAQEPTMGTAGSGIADQLVEPSGPEPDETAPLVGAEISGLLRLEWVEEIPPASVDDCAQFGCATLLVTAPAVFGCSSAEIKAGYASSEGGPTEQGVTHRVELGPAARTVVFRFPPDDRLKWVQINSVTCIA